MVRLDLGADLYRWLRCLVRGGDPATSPWIAEGRPGDGLFRRNRRTLLRDHPGCWMGGPWCDLSQPLEAHHLVPWAARELVDFERLRLLLQAFDPYGYSRQYEGKPITSIDDLRVLVILCDRCHNAKGTGTHRLTMPEWLTARVRRTA